jgi:hypothetical protein
MNQNRKISSSFADRWNPQVKSTREVVVSSIGGTLVGRSPLVWGFCVGPSWWAPFVSRLGWKTTGVNHSLCVPRRPRLPWRFASCLAPSPVPRYSRNHPIAAQLWLLSKPSHRWTCTPRWSRTHPWRRGFLVVVPHRRPHCWHSLRCLGSGRPTMRVFNTQTLRSRSQQRSPVRSCTPANGRTSDGSVR